MRAAVGERADFGRSVGHHGSVDSRRRAEPTGERSGVRREVHRDHLRARRDREHHRRDPGAAAAVHGDPLPVRTFPCRSSARNAVANRQPSAAACTELRSCGRATDSSRHSRPRRFRE